MRDIDRDICYTQQLIYEHAARQGYDTAAFSNAYLSSDFCARQMDTLYSRFQLETPLECEDFYLPEIEPQLVKYEDSRTPNIDAAAWIGYMYRYLYYKTGNMSSRELTKKIPFDKMLAYYPGLHTIDEDNAADIILENLRNR